jgi:DNA repair ATPase RecN
MLTCWAEHLAADDARAAQVGKLQAEISNLTRKHEAQVETLAQKRVSVAASKGAIRRHTENHAMKAQVFAWCDAHLQDCQSMNKAGQACAVAFRTARDWIAASECNRFASTP